MTELETNLAHLALALLAYSGLITALWLFEVWDSRWWRRRYDEATRERWEYRDLWLRELDREIGYLKEQTDDQ